MEQGTIFGRTIGSAARIFQAITCKEDEPELAKFLYTDNCFYGDQSYGRGFLNIALHRFPELLPLAEKGELLLEGSCSEAIGEFQVSLAKLANICSCDMCADEDDRAYRYTKGLKESKRKIFCLPILAQCIIRLIRELTLMEFNQKLLPSRYGLESFYMRHMASYSSGFDDELHDGVNNRHIEMLLAKFGPSGLVQDAITIFAGRYSIGRPSTPAIVCRGLCFYFGILRELSPDVETIVRVYIVPGRIEGSTGRTFEIIKEDIRVKTEPTISYAAKRPIAARQLKASKGSCSPGLDARLVVEEDVESLKIYFRILAAGDNMLCTFAP